MGAASSLLLTDVDGSLYRKRAPRPRWRNSPLNYKVQPELKLCHCLLGFFGNALEKAADDKHGNDYAEGHIVKVEYEFVR